jgi:hypothetical protein
MIISGKKYLITTDELFYAPDSLQYRCIYGRVWVHSFQETFNFPAKNHVNWFITITDKEGGEGGFGISGCRINYFKEMSEQPRILLTNMVMMLGSDNIPFPYYYPNIYIVNEKSE